MLYKKKEEIIDWLDKHKIENYTLKQDENYGYVVDVDGGVNLWGKKLDKIAVKFGKVTEDFNCGHNQLTSLEGSPQEVGEGFWCHDNELTSLEGSPQIVEKEFQCQDNQLTSLEGSPENVGQAFACYNNQLSSLEGMPENVGGKFICYMNPALGELQGIKDFKAIKSYLLAEKLGHDLNIKDNKRKIKL